MLEKILFYLFSLIMISSTFYIIFSKDIFRNFIAAFLIFLSTAALYFLMNLKFIGIFQIIIYTGAIMILFIVAMNTIGSKAFFDLKKQNSNFLYVFLSLLFVLIFGFVVYYFLRFDFLLKKSEFSFYELATNIFSRYPIQLELISLMITIAMVIVYSFIKEEKDEI